MNIDILKDPVIDRGVKNIDKKVKLTPRYEDSENVDYLTTFFTNIPEYTHLKE